MPGTGAELAPRQAGEQSVDVAYREFPTGAFDQLRVELLGGQELPLGGLPLEAPQKRFLFFQRQVRPTATAIAPAYTRNFAALAEVKLTDLARGDIEARLGSSWIPSSDVRNFGAELLGIDVAPVHVGHAAALATWTVRIGITEKWNVSNTTTHGSGRVVAAIIAASFVILKV